MKKTFLSITPPTNENWLDQYMKIQGIVETKELEDHYIRIGSFWLWNFSSEVLSNLLG